MPNVTEKTHSNAADEAIKWAVCKMYDYSTTDWLDLAWDMINEIDNLNEEPRTQDVIAAKLKLSACADLAYSVVLNQMEDSESIRVKHERDFGDLTDEMVHKISLDGDL